MDNLSTSDIDINEDDDDDDELDFELVEIMPTSRLNDVMLNIKRPYATVISLDICLTGKEINEDNILKTILYKLPKNIKVLSLRYNTFSNESIEYLIEWLTKNNFLETIYFMNCIGIDDKNKIRFEEAWKKNLIGHRACNNGYTLLRVLPEVLAKQLKQQQQTEQKV